MAQPKRIPPPKRDPAFSSKSGAPRISDHPSTAPSLEPPVVTPAGDYAALEEQLGKLETQFLLLKDQLRQTQRLASIGTAAAMLAHEYNNLFTPVVSYAKYALDRNDPQLMKKALQTTLKQAVTISSMSDRILGLALDERQAYAPVPVKALIEETIECLGRDLSKDSICLKIDIPETLSVRGNANQLQQVFFNLFLNARHAMLERGGTLTIRAAAKADDLVEISVADTGHGIRPEHLDQIFNPFFTTKREAASSDKKGLGLGLAVSRDIIDEHKGTIGVCSALDQGTTFAITLPAAS